MIGADAVIGSRAVIHDGAVIGAEARIGEDTIVYPNATVYHRCIVGRRCVIHSGAVIGADGYGFATSAGRHHKIPQVGIVRIDVDPDNAAFLELAEQEFVGHRLFHLLLDETS